MPMQEAFLCTTTTTMTGGSATTTTTTTSTGNSFSNPAAWLIAQDDLRVAEYSEGRRALANNEVRVTMKAVGICGSDVHYLKVRRRKGVIGIRFGCCDCCADDHGGSSNK